MTRDSTVLARAAASLKGGCPFRLGTTSYIIPDEILPNVRYLAPRVDDVELVIFESDRISNLPDAAVVAELAAIARGESLTYTVHLPLDAHLALADEAARARSVASCLRVVDRVRSLEPFAWIVHLPGERRGERPADDVDAWRSQCQRSLADLAAAGLDPRLLCVETLDYPFELVEPVVREAGAGVCLDTGHLELGGRDVSAHIERLAPLVRVAHVHGVADGRDHRGLDAMDPYRLAALCRALAPPRRDERTVTIEIFGEAEFAASIAALREALA